MLALFIRIRQRFLPPRPAPQTDEIQAARASFDPEWYLSAYPDVAQAGVDPFDHFWRHGRLEGRLPRRNRALEWEHAIWRGAEDVILCRLRRLLDAPDASEAEIFTARLTLARWYHFQASWVSAIDVLAPEGMLIESTPATPNAALILIEACCRLQQDEKQHQENTSGTDQGVVLPALIEQALCYLDRAFPDTADTALAHANACSVQGVQPALQGLACLNRIYTQHELATLVPIEDTQPLGLDNLAGVASKPYTLTAELPLVSVIVAVFNAEKTLGTALQSLFAQRGVRLEILAVDDASSDDSASVVAAWAERCPAHVTLRLLRHSTNQGAYAARNTGAAEATGTFVTVHDSDDWSHPDKLRCQVAALSANQALMATLSYWVRATPELLFHRWRLDEYGWVYPNISSLMVRKEVIETLGFWDEVKVNADTEYRLRVEAAFGAGSIQEVLPGIPLAFGRSSMHSLSQHTASHVISQFTGMRYHHLAAAQKWHAQAATPQALYLPRKPKERLYYAPQDMLRAGQAEVVSIAPEDRLRASALFDPGWYLERYIDLQSAMIEPFEHFCASGSAEGRDPGPDFSTSGYRRNHQQALAESGLEPWEHYLLHHAQEDAHLDEALPVWAGECSREGRFTVLLCAHQVGATLFGAERSLLDVLDAMNALGWNVVVLLPEAGNTGYEEMLRKQSQAVAVVPYGWWQQGKVPDARTLEHIQRLLKRFRINAVHANTLVLDEPLEAARREGIPAVVHVRELPAHDAALCETLGATPAQLVERTHASADLVIANSQTVASAFSTKQDAQAPIGIVPNTIDMQPLLTLPSNPSMDKASFCVGMLSSNLPKKGLDDIEKVAEALATLAPQVQLRLYGPQSPALDRLLTRQAGKASSGRLVYAGYVESPAQALAEVDAVVNLSHFQESFGRTVLEAMAAGRPVIAYEWGALPELVVEGETGYLVPFAEPCKVAERIAHFSQSPELCRTMGLAGRQRAVNEFGAERLKVALKQSYVTLNAAFDCHF